MRIRQCKGSPTDGDKISKLKDMYEINDNDSEELENIKNRLEEAQNSWQEMKKKGIEYRENELLDLYPNELTEEVLANEYQRKRILRKIYKLQQRKQSFKYMTKHIGKGAKRSLIRVHEKDNNN